MAKTISTAEITGESVIHDVPVLDETTPLTDTTKMYLDIENTFRQIPLSRLFNWLKGKMTQVIYPIGSVYMTFDGQADPATMFGGTWTQIEDRFLLGASTNHPVEELGGNNDVALTIDNLPTHNHTGTTTIYSHNHTPSTSGYNFTLNKDISGDNTDVERLKIQLNVSGTRRAMTALNMGSINQTKYTNTDNHYHSLSIGNTGNGQAFSTMPEYISVYMWRRTG